jgi:lipocalin
MKKISLYLTLAFCLFALVAQAQQVKNVRIETDEEKVTILYDLIASGSVRIFNVCLHTGSAEITPKNTTGAIGKNRSTGINQKIEWYYANDGYSLNQLNNLKIEVIAIDPERPSMQTIAAPKIKKVPIYAGLGTASLTGLGLVIAGFTKHNDAISQYNIYKGNTDPNATVYTELGVTRSGLYGEANKTNKTAQLMMIGGGAVFAAAGAILINRMIWIKRIEKRRRETQQPENLQCQIEPPQLEIKTFSSGSAKIGIGFSYRF